MGRLIDLTGQKFGRWEVLGRAEKLHWICRCECGTEKPVDGGSLRRGDTKSCGCLRVGSRTTHGLKSHPLYGVWSTMRRRCENPNTEKYRVYGGRGIKVCERWKNFQNFYDDMSPTYVQGLQIDREDNDGDYSPDNCRWVTNRQNSRNRGNLRLLTFKGMTMCLAEWAEEVGISRGCLSLRINRRGWTVEEALTTPPLKSARRKK